MSSKSWLFAEVALCLFAIIICAVLTSPIYIPDAVVSFVITGITALRAARKHSLLAPVVSIGVGVLAGTLLSFNTAPPIGALVAMAFSFFGWASAAVGSLSNYFYRGTERSCKSTKLNGGIEMCSAFVILVTCPTAAAVMSFVSDFTITNKLDKGVYFHSFIVIGTIVGVFCSLPYFLLALSCKFGPKIKPGPGQAEAQSATK